MKEVKLCKTCALFDIISSMDKAGRARHGARCFWKSAEVYPISVRKYMNSRPTTSFVDPKEGAECPCWEQRK